MHTLSLNNSCNDDGNSDDGDNPGYLPLTIPQHRQMLARSIQTNIANGDQKSFNVVNAGWS